MDTYFTLRCATDDDGIQLTNYLVISLEDLRSLGRGSALEHAGLSGSCVLSGSYCIVKDDGITPKGAIREYIGAMMWLAMEALSTAISKAPRDDGLLPRLAATITKATISFLGRFQGGLVRFMEEVRFPRLRTLSLDGFTVEAPLMLADSMPSLENLNLSITSKAWMPSCLPGTISGLVVAFTFDTLEPPLPTSLVKNLRPKVLILSRRPDPHLTRNPEGIDFELVSALIRLVEDQPTLNVLDLCNAGISLGPRLWLWEKLLTRQASADHHPLVVFKDSDRFSVLAHSDVLFPSLVSRSCLNLMGVERYFLPDRVAHLALAYLASTDPERALNHCLAPELVALGCLIRKDPGGLLLLKTRGVRLNLGTVLHPDFTSFLKATCASSAITTMLILSKFGTFLGDAFIQVFIGIDRNHLLTILYALLRSASEAPPEDHKPPPLALTDIGHCFLSLDDPVLNSLFHEFDYLPTKPPHMGLFWAGSLLALGLALGEGQVLIRPSVPPGNPFRRFWDIFSALCYDAQVELALFLQGASEELIPPEAITSGLRLILFRLVHDHWYEEARKLAGSRPGGALPAPDPEAPPGRMNKRIKL